MRFALAIWMLAGPVAAQNIPQTAAGLYDRMPSVEIVDVIAGNCGATDRVNTRVVYCTSLNRIFATETMLASPSSGYELAHQYGHAIFVQHGLADIALAAIRANRDREAELRGYVSQQIDCLAGVIYARAGFGPSALSDWFRTEPFTGSHWGRNPLRIGPRASIGLEARDVAFQKGQAAAHPRACEVPELPVELLIEPFRG